MGTLATHSERTFDSLPLVHIDNLWKHGTSGTTMFAQKHPKTFFLQILSWTQGVREPCRLGAMHSRGSLGRGSICDSGISASETALGVGELGEPLRTVCSSCLHVVTAMNLWQFVDDKDSHAPQDWSNSTQPRCTRESCNLYLYDTCRISVWLEGGKCDLYINGARLSQGALWTTHLCKSKWTSHRSTATKWVQIINGAFEICRWNERSNYETIWFHYITWHEHEKGGTKPASHFPIFPKIPKDFSPIYFSPTDFHPYTFRPQTFHPQTLHPQTFHP